MGRQGRPGAPAALPRRGSVQAGQAADAGAAVQVAGEDKCHQCVHHAAQGQHHQHAQSAGTYNKPSIRCAFVTKELNRCQTVADELRRCNPANAFLLSAHGLLT